MCVFALKISCFCGHMHAHTKHPPLSLSHTHNHPLYPSVPHCLFANHHLSCFCHPLTLSLYPSIYLPWNDHVQWKGYKILLLVAQLNRTFFFYPPATSSQSPMAMCLHICWCMCVNVNVSWLHVTRSSESITWIILTLSLDVTLIPCCCVCECSVGWSEPRVTVRI